VEVVVQVVQELQEEQEILRQLVPHKVMMVEFLIPQILLLEVVEVELLLLEQREHQHKQVMVEQEQI
jgi:hypothetical protein